MARTVFRNTAAWLIPLLGLLALGPLAARLLGRLRTDAGLPFATPLISASPVTGLTAAALVLAVALALGLLAARAVDLRGAFNAAGCVLLWGAWRTGPLEETLQSSDPTTAMIRLAIEGALIGLAVWIAAALFESHARPTVHHGVPEPKPKGSPVGFAAVVRATLTNPSGLASIAAAVAAGGAVAWFFAAEPLKNQGVFAALLAGIAAAAAGRIAGQAAGDDPPVSATFFAVGVLACIGPASSIILHGEALDAVARLGQLRGLAGVMPFDWVAGACFGIPIGRAWVQASSAAPSKRGGRPASKPTPRRVTR